MSKFTPRRPAESHVRVARREAHTEPLHGSIHDWLDRHWQAHERAKTVLPPAPRNARHREAASPRPPR
jgi:hypothetical protein